MTTCSLLVVSRKECYLAFLFGSVTRPGRTLLRAGKIGSLSSLWGYKEASILPSLQPLATVYGGHVMEARAFGVKEVLSWIKASNISHVTVETNSLITVQALRSPVNTSSPFDCYIAKCKRTISNLNDVCLRFVKRSANRIAYGLARVSWLYAERSYSVATIPNNFSDVIVQELS
uniref:RNase H type-1 domain-containing protein n=1 Tax=Cannabis sativa TaxID=3483 RepID=A0A803QAQ4_CANSA